MSKINYHHGRVVNMQLRADADTRYDDAEEMFSCYGAHVSGERCDYVIQTVESKWLEEGKTKDELIDLILAETHVGDRDIAADLGALALRIWGDMKAIESQLEEAVRAYEAGDLEACVEALRAAGSLETEHGDDPSTSDLADRLLEPKAEYRVYRAPDGCAPEYCGEYATLEEAQEAAENEPSGLPQSEWDTARAAGHVGGMTAPDSDGEEDDEPESWHGTAGWHYVVKATYAP